MVPMGEGRTGLGDGVEWFLTAGDGMRRGLWVAAAAAAASCCCSSRKQAQQASKAAQAKRLKKQHDFNH